MALPPETIDRVREATDIVEVVSQHVSLKRQGSRWVGLCPFHREKTPSFHVVPQGQFFHCFGCTEGGDVFAFLMQHEKLSFPESVELLAQRAGIPLPRRSAVTADTSLYPVLEWAGSRFRAELAGGRGEPAREYLRGRGLGAETIERYGLGWAPPGWSNLLSSAQGRFDVSRLVRAGLAAENDRGGHYDRFRERLMIPIRSALGQTIGFGARTLGADEPKYLNSPETEVFHKSRILFGLGEARDGIKEAGQALVVEGYMDALAMSQAGFTHVVASCGTAFTEEQSRLLSRYVSRAVLLFDGDRSGLRAAWKSAGMFLGAGIDVRLVGLPDEEDPDSFVSKYGADEMRERVDAAPSVVGFAADVLLDKMERREDLIRAFAGLGAAIDDPIRRRVLLQEAAERFRFDEETLVRETDRRAGAAGVPASTRSARVQAGAVDRLGRIFLARLLATDGAEVGDLDETVFGEPALVELYRGWRALRDQGVAVPRVQLLAEESTRGLTAQVLAESDEGSSLDDLIERLRGRMTRNRGQEIREAIRDAEARGDQPRVEQLLRELHALKGDRSEPLMPRGGTTPAVGD